MQNDADKPVVSRYQVQLVEKINPPEGMPGGEWHRYVIGYGKSKIEGMKPGTLKQVREHAENVVEDLNNRAINKSSVYAPRKK